MEDMLLVSSVAGCALGVVGRATVFVCVAVSVLGALSPTLCKRWRPNTEYWFDKVLVRANKFLGGAFSVLDWWVLRTPLRALKQVQP